MPGRHHSVAFEAFARHLTPHVARMEQSGRLVLLASLIVSARASAMLALFLSFAGCAPNPPEKLASCSQEGATVCAADELLICAYEESGNQWVHAQQCEPGMCTAYAGAYGKRTFGCRAADGQCNGSSDRFCADGMVVACSTDGQPIVVDDCGSYASGPQRYCVSPNDGTVPVCSYLPTLCPENTRHVCVNTGMGQSGPEGIVTCSSNGIASAFTAYVPMDGESCTLRPCAQESQLGCMGNLSGPNRPVVCVDGLWKLDFENGTTCQCSASCL